MLKQGVETWNKWREGNKEIEIDLSGANLSDEMLTNVYRHPKGILAPSTQVSINLRGADLSEATLSGAKIDGGRLSEANLTDADLSRAILRLAILNGAKLSNADFSGADLYGADLSGADLCGADLRGANLRGADLREANLSNAIVDELTLRRTKKVRGGQVGVNGIWAESEITDSAALMVLKPPGNSMQGANPDAVIESLKRARKLHGISMSLVGIILLIALSVSKEIQFPYAKDFRISVDIFGILAMFMSIGLLSLIASFMNDALKGAQYLQDRQSAMRVGNFPWSLSKFTGRGRISKLQSLATRLLMCFHPLVYFYFLGDWNIAESKLLNVNVLYFLGIVLLFFSGWTFLISERFQKPILFDRRTEEEHQNDMVKLVNAVEAQTEAINKVYKILKPSELDNSQHSKDRKSER